VRWLRRVPESVADTNDSDRLGLEPLASRSVPAGT
jgi:hypothetical protein